MPIYEYKCRECGAEFEELVSSRGENPECPRCGSPKTEKLMSACKSGTGGASKGDFGLPPMPPGGGCGSAGGG
ncbi:FmdB family zinc ribbon protein [Salidesulfovibrio onnuriiensis]|uniref:FmdB family zinc ribbon protein n=1 Tax=Salidesulfovibrio onnuriiensis TaxID=2583823 RepID=UPI0011CB9A8B|nr:zinc ribbon domain-containing protein [Salidesulfovibrio onnuriiensis]